MDQISATPTINSGNTERKSYPGNRIHSTDRATDCGSTKNVKFPQIIDRYLKLLLPRAADVIKQNTILRGSFYYFYQKTSGRIKLRAL